MRRHENGVLFSRDAEMQFGNWKEKSPPFAGSREDKERPIAFDWVTHCSFRQHEDQGIERKRNRLKENVIGKLWPKRGSQEFPGNVVGAAPRSAGAAPPGHGPLRAPD